MNSQGKSIDFIRHSSSSDPLVRHAAPTSRSIPVNRPISVVPKKSPKTSPKASPKTSEKTPATTPAKVTPKASSKVHPKLPLASAPKPAIKPEKKPVFILPERPVNPEKTKNTEELTKSSKPTRKSIIPYVEHITKKSEKTTQPQSSRPTPFIPTQVEKRPLGAESKASLDSILDEKFQDPRRLRDPDPVRNSAKQKKSLPFFVVILITIILGIAAGIGVYFLISD